MYGLEIISIANLVNLLPVLWENLVLDVDEEPFLNFCLCLLMLKSNELQSSLTIIWRQNFNVYQTQGLLAIIFNLCNGWLINFRLNFHDAEEILRILSIVLNGTHQCIKCPLVSWFKVNIGQWDMNYSWVSVIIITFVTGLSS